MTDEILYYRVRIRHKHPAGWGKWHWWGWTHPLPGGHFHSVKEAIASASETFGRSVEKNKAEYKVYEIIARSVK